MNKTVRDLGIFIILYGISRLFCLFLPGQYYDFYEDATWGNGLFTPESIYTTINAISQGNAILKYPPLYFPHLSLMLLIFGFYSWSIRLAFTCWEIGILIVLYRLARLFFSEKKDEKNSSKGKALTVLYLYAFSPITILNLIYGQPWFLGVFYLLLGVYAFYSNKPALSGFIFSIGFQTQLYPAFCLIPISAFYLAQKNWKDLVKLVGVFTISFILLCLPFFLYNPDLFFFNFLTHLSRRPQTVTLWTFFIENGLNSFLLFGTVEISLLGIISLAFTLLFFIFSYRYFSRNTKSRNKVFWMIILYYLFLPLVFLTLDFRYIFWMFPILCLFFVPKMKSRWNFIIGLTSTILIIMMSITILTLMPQLLTVDQRIYYDLDEIRQIIILSLSFFLFSLPVYASMWFYFGSFLTIASNEKSWFKLSNVITLSGVLFILTLTQFFPSDSEPYIIFISIIVTIGILLILQEIFFIIENIVENRYGILGDTY